MTPSTAKDLRAAAYVVVIGLGLTALGFYPISNLPQAYGVAAEQIPTWWFVALLLLGAVVVALRSRHAGLALAAGTVIFLADQAIGGSVAVLLVIWELLHHAALVGSARLRLSAMIGVGVLAAAAAVGVAAAESDPRAWISVVLQVAAVGIMPIWWASEVRRGNELAAAAAERARLETERADAVALAAERERAQAVREERTAMARDLHDVVTSHLSAIAIHSGAALAAPPDAARDREALAQVRRESVASLEDMRTMVRLLRTESVDGWATSAGLSELPALVERYREAGLDLTTDTGAITGGLAGEPAGAEAAHLRLPTAVEQAAVRVTQEALTNALRHGAGDAHLELDLDDGRLELAVTNELHAGGAAGGSDGRDRLDAGPSGGVGLASMRERTEGAGGTFQAGARDGVWQVRATFPTEEKT